jgi:hypothetical protein
MGVVYKLDRREMRPCAHLDDPTMMLARRALNRTGIGAIRSDQQLALRVRQDEDDNDSLFPANTPLVR